MSVPAQLKFTAEHEWLDIEGDRATVGITAFAAEALGDVVYVDLPAVGSSVAAGEACGEIESTKSVSELYAPADGDVVEVNQAVVDDPGLLNLDPFGAGWLFRMRVTNSPALLDAAAYESLTGGE
ncbi:glycine cleavage system protein GcvH [Micromonospora sp. DR5-3]|uniref:glycine cleavage system protein GcvH n=1 Tax=unclassified Micromonospora TaxID=2617518 RepID=UPI0011D478CC|nr:MULTISPECIES: glycine cleavage system protein GcvH [unclassified Micromonospora]MCW3818776.1 glycine cleavage system protein GcvH [Micromonospora sp. DR5-3]TYC21566.1 glycine cleavage system protein GcvH [Micromonospora sp. MP36]